MLFVQIYGDLRIALASELVAFGAQLFSDLIMPIQLPVDDCMYMTFGVVKGLLGFRS